MQYAEMHVHHVQRGQDDLRQTSRIALLHDSMRVVSSREKTRPSLFSSICFFVVSNDFISVDG